METELDYVKLGTLAMRFVDFDAPEFAAMLIQDWGATTEARVAQFRRASLRLETMSAACKLAVAVLNETHKKA